MRIAAYHDGQLPEDEVAAVEALLEEDPSARAYLELLKQMRTLLEGSESAAPELDPEWDAVAQRLEDDGHPRKVLIPFPLMAAGGLAAAFAVGLITWLAFSKHAPIPQTAQANGYAGEIEIIDTSMEHAYAPIVYVDDESGWTVVWVEEIEDELPAI